MVNILVGDRNKSNINILRQKFTEDNKFKIQNAVTGKDTILEYWKLNPDIYMRDAIIYCYYNFYKLELLNDILNYLAYKYNVSYTKVRDSLKACIRNFNSSTVCNVDKELFDSLYNNGYGVSLKTFIEKIVIYLIKTKNKGRLF